MSDEQRPSERRSISTDGFVPAVGQRLRNLLAEVTTEFPCRYALFIHPRSRGGDQGFGVITMSGESLPLTVALLESLRQVPTLFDGHARLVVGPGDDQDVFVPAGDGTERTAPLEVQRISVRISQREPGGEPGIGQEHVLRSSARGPQLTLLCAARPAGWPP